MTKPRRFAWDVVKVDLKWWEKLLLRPNFKTQLVEVKPGSLLYDYADYEEVLINGVSAYTSLKLPDYVEF